MNPFKRLVLILLTALVHISTGYSLDINIRAVPELTLPLGGDSGLYSLGGGGSVHADVSLFNFFAPGIQTGVQVQPLLNVGTSLVLVRAGAEANFYGYPISRLFLSGGGGFGLYLGMHPDADNFSGLYWSLHADVGYRFSPSFTLSAGAEYRSYLYNPDPVFSGIAVNVGARLQLGALRGRDTGINVETIRDDPVFPIFYSMYGDIPIATVRIINNEQAELRDVEVYFQAGDYTSRELLLETVPLLRKGASLEVPLYALFNEKILGFSEDTKIEGEILVRYKFLNAPREAHHSKTLVVHHRNAARWEDDRIAAAFVSPNDPSVLEYSKFIAGIVREQVRPDISNNLQYGMGLFEGLRLSEIRFTPDPSSPYRESRGNTGEVDYIQYPYQTIAYKGGDRDDLGILYAAVLESVGIHAAFIPLPNEFLIAVDLNMDEEAARAGFYFHEDLIFREGAAWVPLQVSLIKEGFMRAWIEGIDLVRSYTAAGNELPFIPLAEAWRQYPSVGVYGDTSGQVKPLDEKVINAFENSLYRFIRREVDPQADALIGRIDPAGENGRVYNRLGILYAMYGLLPEAKGWFVKAFEDGFHPAAVNLGNVAFLLEDYEAAVVYFSRAFEHRPNNGAALIGLARAKYELDVFSEADELYEKIREVDPDLAARYSYLSSRVEGSVSRASSAADRKGDLLWDENE